MTARVILPLDILIYIADILAEEPDPNVTLQSLSRICMSMVSPCRRHLFSSIALSPYDKPRLHKFSDLLRTDPQISRYVKHLMYYLPGTTSQAACDSYEQHILKTLSEESSLQSIHFDSSGMSDWNTLPVEGEILLSSLMQLPSITTLKFTYFSNFPIAALSHCGSLLDLELDRVVVTNLFEANHLIKRTAIPTPTIFCAREGSYRVLEALMRYAVDGPFIEFGHLRQASFHAIANSDISTIIELLHRATGLQHLNANVDAPLQFTGLGEALAAGALRTLKSAEFCVQVNSDSYPPLCGLNHELRRLAGINILETLDVYIFVGTNFRCDTGSEDWSDLDKVLTEAGAFPKLGEVSVFLTWDFYGGFEIDDILNKLTKDRFPRLLEATSIKFDFSEDHDYL